MKFYFLLENHFVVVLSSQCLQNPSQVNKVSWSEEHLQFTIQLGYFSCFSLQIWAIRQGKQKWYVLSVLWMPQNYIIRFALSTWLWIMSSVGSFVAGIWSNKNSLLSFYWIASWEGLIIFLHNDWLITAVLNVDFSKEKEIFAHLNWRNKTYLRSRSSIWNKLLIHY